MSDRGHIFGSDPHNIHFAKHAGPVLFAIRDKDVAKPARLLEHDPTALRRWRAGETENDRAWMKRFTTLCRFAAKLLESREPGVEVRIVLRPRLEEAKDKIHARNLDNNEQKRHDAHDAYREIDADVERILDEEGCGVEAAIGLYQDRLARKKEPEVSRSKIMRARAFVRAERAGALKKPRPPGVSEEEWAARQSAAFEANA